VKGLPDLVGWWSALDRNSPETISWLRPTWSRKAAEPASAAATAARARSGSRVRPASSAAVPITVTSHSVIAITRQPIRPHSA
jgi:hypothetical protein